MVNFKNWIFENSGYNLIPGVKYKANDIVNFTIIGDLQSISEWMNSPLDKLAFRYELVSMRLFAKEAEEMFNTYEEFPQDGKRTNKIIKILKQNQPYPVFVEDGDPNNFIMEGRHRIVAFWKLDKKEVPVFYVSKLT